MDNETQSLPEILGTIGDFSALLVRPGDVLIVHFAPQTIVDHGLQGLTAEIKEVLESHLDCKVLFVAGVDRFEVLRPDDEQ